MNKSGKKKFKREMANQLRKFGDALFDNKAITNKKPFEDAANQCQNGPMPVVKGVKINTSTSWGYEISNIVFNIPKGKKARGVYPKEASCESVSVSAIVIGNYLRNDYAEDPYSHLELNVVSKGKKKDGTVMLNSWHLDRHLTDYKNKQPKEAHPIYHFQYGGQKLRLPDSNYGTHLVLDTPRLMHLPLDAVLGVDFVLSNFLGDLRNRLCDAKPYHDCVKESQKSIWRPYIHSIAKIWAGYGEANYDWDVKAICPQIL